MTREQFDKAESIVNQYDIVQKQLEVTKSLKYCLIDMSNKEVSRKAHDDMADDLKELCLALLLDNVTGAKILSDAVASIELSLTRQCVSLSDQFNNL